MDILLQDRFLLVLIAFFCGAMFGSFATALIWRLPRDLNWVSKRSQCTKCGYKLGVLDLIPIFSYIISGGKCRNCKTRYGVKYFLIELLMAAGFAVIFYFSTDMVNSAILALLYFAIIVLSVIDFEHYIIPDEVNIFIFILSIWYGVYNEFEIERIIINPFVFCFFSLALRQVMYLWKKKEALGLGDVKFFFAIGIFLSIETASAFLFLSGIVGILIAIYWRIMGLGKKFPFGPALSVALFLCVAFPEIGPYMLKMTQDLIYS
jgi:leader peptidase (prepilin peptidase)/N-methyltransferase